MARKKVLEGSLTVFSAGDGKQAQVIGWVSNVFDHPHNGQGGHIEPIGYIDIRLILDADKRTRRQEEYNQEPLKTQIRHLLDFDYYQT